MRPQTKAKTKRHQTTQSAIDLKREIAQLKQVTSAQKEEIEGLKSRLETAKKNEQDWRMRYMKAQERQQDEVALLNLRIKELQETLEQVKTTLAWHEKHSFGDRTEKTKTEKKEPRGSRGKREGAPGYGRKDRPNLDSEEVQHDVSPEKRTCSCCGKPYRRLGSSNRSKMIELVQQLFQVVDTGHKYVKDCPCDEGSKPRIVAADPPARLYPRALLGPMLWADILVEKFLFQKPLQRISQKYQLLGAHVPVSTICSGLKKIAPMLDDLYEGIKNRAKGAEQWNMDETMWRVFGTNNRSDNRKWWLWVVVTADCWLFLLDPKRSSDVPKTFFEGVSSGVLITDRYSAYKSLLSSIRKAYCWAHVRRDFLKIRDGIPRLHDWADEYVTLIDQLFDLNEKRTAVLFADSDEQQDTAFYAVKYKLDEIQRKSDRELRRKLNDRQKKVLTSLKRHWEGLTIFLNQPQVPMDNNAAERALRNAAVGRKMYYGSGSDWSGEFAAKMFTILQTWLCNGLDPIKMLEDFLTKTAEARGQPPPADDYLPWKMPPERQEHFRLALRR